MPLVETRGAASAQGFGEFAQASAVPNYIEDVFSTFLYSGTGASQTITNGIDLSTKGGLTWIKGRSGATGHRFTDTARGVTKSLESNSTAAEATETTGLTAFGTTGFTIGADADYNTSSATYASWTFREQPKFFDVVTYTGTGSNTTIAHSLGAVPGSIIVKRTDTTAAWAVYHRSLANTQYLVLNTTAAAATGATWWNSTTPTSAVFSVGTDASVNASSGTYVAYIFAHDAGGFGLTGTDNVISCGSYAGTGAAGNTITLGYEPQWLMVKASSRTSTWTIVDNMRSFSETSGRSLFANNSNAEDTPLFFTPTATGFKVYTTSFNANASGETYIYIAIRRGPMKVPTSGTSVFSTSISSADTGVITSGFVTDMVMTLDRTASGVTPFDRAVVDRLRGNFKNSSTATTATEVNNTSTVSFGQNNGIYLNGGGVYANGYVYEQFARAPSFFDEVCYVGNDADNTQTHNLKVKPELVISKSRSAATNGSWGIWSAGNGVVNNDISGLTLNSNAAAAYPNFGNSSKFTATTFGADWVLDADGNNKNQTGVTYVTYLFATCAGVSKVFSYTGNGSSKTIDCGFTGGARFVLIKRTDSTGDWYVWDTARNIVSGNDPHLSLNSTAAEVTTDDTIDTDTTGFIVNQVSATNVNVTDATYIGLAIA